MVSANNGIVTLIEDLDGDLRTLSSQLPFLEDKPVDHESVKQQFDIILERVAKLREKTQLSHTLVQSVINSIYASRKELKDSVDGLLKKTGDQLGKITATTEVATNKILDEAMKLDGDQNTIIDKLEVLKSHCASTEVDEMIEPIKAMVYDNQDSVFNIIQFLQFQDITAQQIKGAYSLLHDTEKTLLFVSNLLKAFDLGENNIELTLPSIDTNAFNADAVFSNKADIQGAIDDLFSTGNENIEIPKDVAEGSSSDLSGGGAPADSSSDEDFDIDALFSGGASANEKANQDDIDKLFS